MAGELPPGFTLDEMALPPGPNGVPRINVSPPQKGLPEGFTLDPPGVVEDMAKGFAGGFGKGVAGLFGLPGDLRNFIGGGMERGFRAVDDYFGVQRPGLHTPSTLVTGDNSKNRPPDIMGTGASVRRNIESVTGPFYEPQTTPGQYSSKVGEFAAAAPLLPGGPVAKAVQTVIPALMDEGGGQLAKKYAPGSSGIETGARLLGGLTGGVLTGIATRPSTAQAAIRGQLPPGITAQHVTQAEALMADAAQRGVQLSWPEAISRVAERPVLQNTMRHLEGSPQTQGRMEEFFAPRPQQVEGAARQEFGNLAPPITQPQNIRPAMQEAATEFHGDVRDAINRAATPHYNAASTEILPAADFAQVQAAPGWQRARDAVRNDEQLNRYVANLPDDSIGFLNEVMKLLRQQAEHATSPVTEAGRNLQRSAGFGTDADLMRTVGTNNSQNLTNALAIEARGRAQYLDPLTNGPIGKISEGRDAIKALFPAGPDAGSQDTIRQAVTALSARSPRLTRDLIRLHAENTFTEAAKSTQSGMPNQMAGANFYRDIAGHGQQRANLQAAVEAGIPNGADVWQGFERFLEIARATGHRMNVGSRTAYNMSTDANTAGGLVRDIGRIGAKPTSFLAPLAERYDRWALGRDLNGIAEILTNPNAANQLRAIARMAPDSPRSLQIARRLATQYGAAQDSIKGPDGGR